MNVGWRTRIESLRCVPIVVFEILGFSIIARFYKHVIEYVNMKVMGLVLGNSWMHGCIHAPHQCHITCKGCVV